MEETISFQGKDYTQESLKTIPVEDLLTLRNEIAASLNIAQVKGFKDQEQGVSQAWKALTRLQTERAKAETKANKPAKAPKAPKEPKERKPAKSSAPHMVKRPTRKHFATIEKIGEHNGTDHGRHHRWENYKDGMTLADVIEADGTEPWDVYNWASKGILRIVEANDEQYAARRAAWYKKHNLTDPDLNKEQKAADRAAAKEAREKERAAKAEAKAEAARKAAEAKAEAPAAA